MHQSAKVLLEARRDKKGGEKRKKEKGRRREMTKKRERERGRKCGKRKKERKCVGCIDRGFKLHRHQKRPTVFEVQQG